MLSNLVIEDIDFVNGSLLLAVGALKDPQLEIPSFVKWILVIDGALAREIKNATYHRNQTQFKACMELLIENTRNENALRTPRYGLAT